MLLSHFPGFLTAYCSCDCIEKKLVALDLGWLLKVLMHSSGSSKVVMAAGSQGLLFPAHSGLIFAAISAVFRATGKKYPRLLSCFSDWISPRAKLTNFSS